MPLRTFRLEEDRTGISPNNLIPNEAHKLPATGVRFFVTKRGPFFTKSVRMVDAASGRLLVPRIDYDCIQLEVEQTTLSGKEVCSIIVIRNEEVSDNILVTYQAYGGWLSYSVTAIVEMIEALNLDVLEITWGQIIGVPDRLPAAPHRHPLSDVYGWHKLFPGLGAIRDAIITGNQPLLDSFRTGIQTELDDLERQIIALNQSILTHVNATGNVHNLNIHQINGYTQTEINDRLAQRLPIDGTAVNSNRLYGRDAAQFTPWVHSILSYNNITQGIVPFMNRAAGFRTGVSNQVVTSDGYKPFRTMMTDNWDLFETRLGVDATAVNSNRLFGRNQAEFAPWIHSILNYSNINLGAVPARNRAPGWVNGVPDQVVTADGYVTFKTLLDRNLDRTQSAGIFYAGDVTSSATARLMFANDAVYPPPCLVAYEYRWKTSHGYGNGGSYTINRSRQILDMKIAPGTWVNVADSDPRERSW